MKIEFIDKFIVRTPYASIDEIETLSEIKDIYKDGVGFIENTFEGHFKMALLYASKNFFYEIEKTLKSKSISEKLFYSYLKYYLRYCSRSTPFGLFSTYGICEANNTKNHFSIQIEESNVKIRVNPNYIYRLCTEISKNKNLWKYCFLYPNQTIYHIDNEIRYNELSIDDEKFNYRLSSFSNNEILNYILSLTNRGINFGNLCIKIKEEGYDEQEVQDYINQLIENNVLLIDVFPSPATNKYLDGFLKKLTKIKENDEIINVDGKKTTIKKIINEVSELRDYLYNEQKKCDDEVERIESLLIKNSEKIDLTSYRKAKANINFKELYHVQNTLMSLYFLNSRRKEKDPVLQKFVQEFKDKYGESELPLLHVIDPELGIFNDRINSISTPILEGITFSKPRTREYKFTGVDDFLFDKYQNALIFDKKEIIITKEECLSFKTSIAPILSQTLSCNISFFRDKNDVVNTVLHGAYGSSSINNMGRFSFGSEELQGLAEDIVRKEYSNTNNLIEYGEIVDLPITNHGNLVVRENYLHNEILINIPTVSNNEKKKINLSDISVSIKNDDVILKNVKTNKIVIPRLSNSHNFQLQNLSHIYRFLSLIQLQWDNSIKFSWGFIESFAKYTPRVRIEKIIVKEASWSFNKNDLFFLKSKEKDIYSDFKRFKREWNIPDKVFLVEGDQKLFFNFSSKIFVDLFVDTVSRKSTVAIIEDIQKGNNSLVFDKNQKKYYSELIVPIILREERKVMSLISDKKEKISPKLLPLSECLYINIYTGEQQIDSFIKNELFELNTKLFKKELIKSFFFIRYNEEGHHIRLRYFIENNTVYNTLFSYLNEVIDKYARTNVIKSFNINTYKREIDRYNYGGIKFTEHYFGQESQMVILLLKKIEQIGFNERWLIGIIYIDKLLDKLSYSLEEKKELLFKLSYQFNKEFNSNKYLKKIISTKYKNNEANIKKSLLQKNIILNDIYNIIDYFLNSFSFKEILKKENKQNKNSYVGSLIHMYLNRLLISQHRRQELLIYNFLLKYYNSLFNQRKT